MSTRKLDDALANVTADDPPAKPEAGADDVVEILRYRPRMKAVMGKYRNYMRVTTDELGVASLEQTRELDEWVSRRAADVSRATVEDLERTYDSYYSKMLASAHTLYHDDFIPKIKRAHERGLISEKSQQQWIARMRDPAVHYKAKEYWVHHQLPHYMENWEKAQKERATLLADPQWREIDPTLFDLRKISDQDAFLKMHYEDRIGLLAKARGAIKARETDRSDLFVRAKTILNQAVAKKVLSSSKTGIWLERIFSSSSPRQKIETFLKPGRNSIHEMIKNWTDVKKRYDFVVAKMKTQQGNLKTRGLYMVAEKEFLNMHYDQRLKYVKEVEQRLNDAKDANKERPEFLNIRHALDMRDWEDADEYIATAERLADLSNDDRQRLSSMKQFLSRMRDDKKVTGKRNAESQTPQMEAVQQAHLKVQSIMHQMPSTLQSMVGRLLKSRHANRNINQFRWIVYNNKWCRDHHFLNHEKARAGASKQNTELTKRRAKRGEDVGKHDSIDDLTAGQEFFRKDQMAKRKATLLHVNVKSQSANNALAEKLEHEIHPRVLYWTTWCGHEDGIPMSDNWHNDLFMNLTELRSATKVLESASYRYGGLGMPLVPFSGKEILN